MATIGPVSLTITLDGTGWVDVVVEYTITWGDLDKLANLGYFEDVTLWGDDPRWDDRIRPPMVRDHVYPNGEDTLPRVHSARLRRSKLNEDPAPGDDDEIYARVTLQDKEGQFRPVTRRSNTVTIGN